VVQIDYLLAPVSPFKGLTGASKRNKEVKVMIKIKGAGVIERKKDAKGKIKSNVWLITHYLGERDEKGRYKRAPRKTVHGTKADARKALEEYRLELEGKSPIEAKGISFAEYARRFHELREGTMGSPLSYRSERLDIERIEKLFPRIELQELTPAKIRDIYAKARRDKIMSENALHKAHVKARQILQVATIDEIIMRNPFELVSFPRPKSAERKSLSVEEAARFFSALEGSDLTGSIIALYLLIRTGMRRGEVLGLTWEYVDLKNNSLFVAKQYASDKKLRPPKSKKSQRWLSYSQDMADLLCRWKQQQAELFGFLGIEQTEKTPVVNNDLGDFIDPDNFSRWFRNWSADNDFGRFTKDIKEFEQGGKIYHRGKGYEGLTIHELRHTQVTLLIAHQTDLRTVQDRMGHSQPSLTLGTYAHAVGANDIAAAETIDNILRNK